MAQWQALSQLDLALQRQVVGFYDKTGFSREIRQLLGAWLENQDWDLATVDKSKANECYSTVLMFVEEQERRSIQSNNILYGPDFSKIKDDFLSHFNGNPLKLARVLSDCLREEKRVLNSALKPQSLSTTEFGQSDDDTDIKIDQLKRQALELKTEIQALLDMTKSLDFKQNTRNQEQLLSSSKAALEFARHILKQAEQIVQALTGVEMSSFKRRQQMACIGSPVEVKLDHLQKWFSGVAEVLLEVCEQLEKLKSWKYCRSDVFTSNLHDFGQSLFEALILKALVVEKQPVSSKLQHRPLILKTGVCFEVTLRFLVDLPRWKPLLKVKPVFDKDVEEATSAPGFRFFDFKNNESMLMNVNKESGALTAEFQKLKIEVKKGRTSGSQESSFVVTEELHMITFVMTLQHGGYKYDIQASSLPVVVITSTNQVPNAWASIMWWNMLSTSEPWNLSLFADPPPLHWEELAQALSWQFLSIGHRELDRDNLAMIKSKILGDRETALVDWITFSKENTTWIWIDNILNLIKNTLGTVWRDGHIMGFVSKEGARSLLQEKPSGTFVLRFSESILAGAITFSWVERSNGNVCVHPVKPYRKEELKAKPLFDSLFHYNVMRDNKLKNPLLFLYPDIPKDVICRCCCNNIDDSVPQTPEGYLPRTDVSISIPPTPLLSPNSVPESVEDMDTDIDSIIQDLYPSLLDQPALTPDIFE